MAQDPDAIRETLESLLRPNARGRLLARGRARGMVWRDGIVPEGGPNFPDELTPDLLDVGYAALSLALELRDVNLERANTDPFETSKALELAAEAIESAVRRGNPNDADQGRQLVICAAALHLAGYAARSYSLLPPSILSKNLATPELALAYLLRRDLNSLRKLVVKWLSDPRNTDQEVAKRIAIDVQFGPEDAAITSQTAAYLRSLGLADTALLQGESTTYEEAISGLRQVTEATGQLGNIPLWWITTLSIHLVRDLWRQSLHMQLPPDNSGDLPVALPDRWPELRKDFISQLAARNPPHIDLWPSQLEAAARSINPRDDLVIALPTSAGKTRIAELCILRALADQKRIFYVTPLRALSAQVERILAKTFVPLKATVSSLYGAIGATSIDTDTLVTADIVVATPEKLDFALRQDPDILNNVGLVVFDEGHMIGLGSREIRYEVLIQRLLRREDYHERRIVCLSAMFNPDDPYFQDFGTWLRSGDPGDPVHVRWSPTRRRLATLDWSQHSDSAILKFLEGEEAFVPRFIESQAARKPRRKQFPSDEIEFCISAAHTFARDGHNVLIYSPQRSQIEPVVKQFELVERQGFLPDLKRPRPEHLAVAMAIGREWLGEDHPAVKGLIIGVGMHHGALPRPFLSAVEELLNARRLPIVVASPTLAQGIDLSCSVLIFRSLMRFDPETKRPKAISAAEFSNVIGRAGRAFVDLDGIVVAPSFEGGSSRRKRHKIFNDLIEESKQQRLRSGLAVLIIEISKRICRSLGVQPSEFSEYVLNNRDLWSDGRISEAEEPDGEDHPDTRNLAEYLSDLDVALFSLIEDLSATDDLASILDNVLKDSLWTKTVAHYKQEIRTLEHNVLTSRAEWLWRNSTAPQRQACFNSGLGHRAGVFLYDNLDELVGALVDFHSAIINDKPDDAAGFAVAFADKIMEEPFFATHKPPADWHDVLSQWIKGVKFSEILAGRNSQSQQKVQALVQDGVIYKMVWAAEAVRVQAIATDHSRSAELGDGPAVALTSGVCSIQAGLLCQMGFASRSGSLHAARTLRAAFTTLNGMRDWLREHEVLLLDDTFWENEDQYLLWRQALRKDSDDYPRPWTHGEYHLAPKWTGTIPTEGASVRLVVTSGRSAQVCTPDLKTVGTLELPFDPAGTALKANMMRGSRVRVHYFGRRQGPF